MRRGRCVFARCALLHARARAAHTRGTQEVHTRCEPPVHLMRWQAGRCATKCGRSPRPEELLRGAQREGEAGRGRAARGSACLDTKLTAVVSPAPSRCGLRTLQQHGRVCGDTHGGLAARDSARRAVSPAALWVRQAAHASWCPPVAMRNGRELPAGCVRISFEIPLYSTLSSIAPTHALTPNVPQ